ncbi:hypothetical protein 1 [Forsythia suspensa tombusvirus]|nr:hypothetical protein 1 [Forsythia suspensa tombusvirus]
MSGATLQLGTLQGARRRAEKKRQRRAAHRKRRDTRSKREGEGTPDKPTTSPDVVAAVNSGEPPHELPSPGLVNWTCFRTPFDEDDEDDGECEAQWGVGEYSVMPAAETPDGRGVGVPPEGRQVREHRIVVTTTHQVGGLERPGGSSGRGAANAPVAEGQRAHVPCSTRDDGQNRSSITNGTTAPGLVQWADRERPTLRVSVEKRVPRGCWESIVGWLRRFALVCICLGDVSEDWVVDEAIRAEVSAEMLESDGGVVDVGPAIADECGLAKVGGGSHAVVHVPRFVAASVATLRVKLGLGVMETGGAVGAANLALVRREAAKLMRDWGVRDMDGAAHLLLIERAFFEDDTHYHTTLWRERAVKRSRVARALLPQRGPVFAGG